MSESNFINEVKFNKGEENLFPPFKGGDKIFLGGEKEVQNLIKFYLKDKEIKDSSGKTITPEENASRFKINCVLGNNGGGKSRLFEGIINKELEIENIDNKEIILDDFFVGSSNLNYSINNYSINGLIQSGTRGKHIGVNILIAKLIFLENKYPTILKSFFGYKFSGKFEIKFNRANDGTYKNIISKKILDIGLEDNVKTVSKLKNAYGINIDSFETYVEYILEKLFNYFNLKKNNINNRSDIIDKFLSTISYKLSKIKKGTDIFKDNISKYFDNKYNFEEIFKDNVCLKKGDYIKNDVCINNTVYINEKKLIKKIFKILEGEKNIKAFEIFVNYFLWGLNISFLNDNEEKVSFESLSAGEQTNLIRFINIFTEIVRFNNNGLNENIILIDEPDLHLHLDWQRQYIQKLIDVFSTLDTNIKLHFIIATHSPFVISDLPTECIIKLEGDGKEGNGKRYTKVTDWWGNEFNDEKKSLESKVGKGTFGANFIDIINDGFFFENEILMGSFAKENIKNLSQVYKTKILLETYSIKENNFENNKEIIKLMFRKIGFIGENKEIENFSEYQELFKNLENLIKIENYIGDKFLKENLLYL